MNIDFQNEIPSVVSEGVKLPVIQIIYDSWVKPKLNKFFINKKIDKHLSQFTSDLFYNYLSRSYEQNKVISILAIGNQEVHIDKIYQPLTLSKGEYGVSEQYIINNYPNTLIDKYSRLLIVDQAGMGKSTLMKKMFVSAIENNYGVPIFIELRKLNENQDILDYILDSLSEVDSTYDKDILVALIKRGDFIFFLDGYDEIQLNIKEKVTTNLKKFISHARKNKFILTSRPNQTLISFSDFTSFKINALKVEEAYELFEKYDVQTNFNLALRIRTHIDESRKTGSLNDLISFLGNPLLVSFIYITYKHKRNIPFNKDDFYRKVYDALYEDHDYSKDGYNRGKYSGISKEQLHKFLRKLGFLCLLENQNDYSKDKLISLIDDAKKTTYIENTDSSDLFRDLIETVPIFSQDGLSYKWSHKSFMEYFASSYVFMDQANQKEMILKQMVNSEYFDIYSNFLDIFYDMDLETFDNVIVLPILNDYLDYMGDIKKLKKNHLILKSLLYRRAYVRVSMTENKKQSLFSNIYKHLYEEVSKKYNLDTSKFTEYDTIFRHIGEKEVLNKDSNSTIIGEGILSDNQNCLNVLDILNRKKSVLINDHSQEIEESKIIYKCVTYLDNVELMSTTKVNSLLKFIRGLILMELIDINYDEALKYKERIEKHIALKKEFKLLIK